MSPAINRANAAGDYTVHYKHEIEFDRVMNRNTTFGLTFKHYSGLMQRLPVTLPYISNIDPDALLATATQIYPVSVGVIRANNIGFNWKFFQGRKLPAPIGTYHQLGIEAITYTIDVDNSMPATHLPADFDFDRSEFTEFNLNSRYYLAMVDYTIGTQKVVFNRLVLKAAVQAGYVFSAFKTTQTGSWLTNKDPDPGNYMAWHSSNRIFNMSVFNVKLGIGYIL